MSKINKIISAAIVVLMLSGISNARVDWQNSPDSSMRTYQEVTYGDTPSPGYYTYWSAYVTSDRPQWVRFGFVFDSGTVNRTVYIVPDQYTYISAPGYMKTWTNRVDITTT